MDLHDSKGVQVGDHNTQVNNYFLERDIGPGSAAALTDGIPAGRLLAEVTDPFDLEVHRPVQTDEAQLGLSALPTYVSREHDSQLAGVVRTAANGTSGIAVLVGGSSTGKTRACWEALWLLRERPEQWRLWHPIDPSRPEAALRELPSIGPRTVVWLNEAQFYLDAASDGLGERIAAGLREALRDPGRAPVLVLATLWPQYWGVLTASPMAGADAHSQARELLALRDISVPSAFTAAQLRELIVAGDPRLARAAVAAEDRQVVQFLAGAPELMARYRNAPPAAAALISAAIDARRLGMGIALPLAFLERAAPGYLTDTEWDALGEDWLEQGLAYTAALCKGIRGPLAPIHPRPIDNAVPAPGVAYRLADYLEQHGRRERRLCIPPADFWAAAARFADTDDFPALARAAETRGLLRDAARLRKQAASKGDTSEAVALLRSWQFLHPYSVDPSPARWAATHAALDDPSAVALLLDALRESGAQEQVAVLLARDPAAHVALDDPRRVALLLDALRESGAQEQVAALLARDPAAHVALDDLYGVALLLAALRDADSREIASLADRVGACADLDDPVAVAVFLQASQEAGVEMDTSTLLDRAAAHVALYDLDAVAWLLGALRESGAAERASALAGRIVASIAVDDPISLAWLLDTLREVEAPEQVAALLARDPAAHAALDDPYGVALLLDALRAVGAQDQVAALVARDPAARTGLDNLEVPDNVVRLLTALQEAGAAERASALADRVAAHASLDRPAAVSLLLAALQKVDRLEQASALLARDPAAHVALDDPYGVGRLLTALRKADGPEQASALLARDPAAHVSLDDLDSVVRLIAALREAGATEQASALADRAAGHARLDNPRAVARLLDTFREMGAPQKVVALLARSPAAHATLDKPADVALLLTALRRVDAGAQSRALADRLPAEGEFALFRKQLDHQVRYKFGREPGGSPAPSWDWDDLG